jgi:hypothetical protein
MWLSINNHLSSKKSSMQQKRIREAFSTPSEEPASSETLLTAIFRPVLAVCNLFGMTCLTLSGRNIQKRRSILLRLWHYTWILVIAVAAVLYMVAGCGSYAKKPKECLGPRFDAMARLFNDFCYISFAFVAYFMGVARSGLLEQLSEIIADVEDKLEAMMTTFRGQKRCLYSATKVSRFKPILLCI